MPIPLVNQNSVIVCQHGGVTTLSKGDPKCILRGSRAIRIGDLIGSTISGCSQIGSGKSPCTVVVSVTSGITRKLLSTSGPYIKQDLIGVTNGSPVNILTCSSPGQIKTIEK